MSLAYRERRRLRNVDRALRRSDPGLAAMLSIFTQLNEAEELPGREQLRVSRSWALAWRLVLWPVAGAAFLVVCVAGGGLGTSRRLAHAVSLNPASWASRIGAQRRPAPWGWRRPATPPRAVDGHLPGFW